MTMAWMARAGRRFEDLAERLRMLLRPGLRAAAEAAGTLDRLDLGRIFTAPAVDSDWNRAAAPIEALGITAEAGMNPGGRRALYYLVRHLRPGLRPLWPDGKVIQGPQLAVQRLQRAGWPIEAQPLGELPWPTKQGTSMTSMALLGGAGVGRAGVGRAGVRGAGVP
jgi:hypothetical protein